MKTIIIKEYRHRARFRLYISALPLIRAKHLFQTEGLIPLIRRGVAFLVARLFVYRTYYLYECAVIDINEADFRPKIQNFVFKVVRTNQQADELAADGFEFRSSNNAYRYMLDKGAIATCIFIEQQLAYVTWIALTEESKKSIEPFPYTIDFSKNEAASGATLTNPNYRGKGLAPYGFVKQFQFLKEMGTETIRGVVLTNNISSQRFVAKFNANIYAEARYLRILWWKIWREKPIQD
jgi:hypothetical protein